jgi:bacteriorhodopsin
MKYKTNITVELPIFLKSVECTNCISAQDMKILILLPPFCLFEKYIARQEEIPQVYMHFINIMAFLFSGYLRLWLLGGKADDLFPSKAEIRMYGAIPPYLHFIP